MPISLLVSGMLLQDASWTNMSRHPRKFNLHPELGLVLPKGLKNSFQSPLLHLQYNGYSYGSLLAENIHKSRMNLFECKWTVRNNHLRSITIILNLLH